MKIFFFDKETKEKATLSKRGKLFLIDDDALVVEYVEQGYDNVKTLIYRPDLAFRIIV